MPNNEANFNYALGEVLQCQRQSWRERVQAEMNGSIVGGPARGRADILIYPDNMQPVVVESAFEETANIDGDAIARLGKKESQTMREIMTAVAVKIPLSARDIPRGTEGMREWLLSESAILEYAIYSTAPGEQGKAGAPPFDIRYPDGKPNSGYLCGSPRDLANLIELAATPDKKIKQVAYLAGGEVRGIGAQMMSGLKPQIQNKIADKVGQPPDEHAMRVAACVWLNALSLHSKLAFARPDEVGAPSQCKTLGQIAQAWEDILKIDYKSVFLPARDSLMLLEGNEALAKNVLDRLRKQVDAINSLQLGGVADVSSDMFPELATDRKVTAAYYTKMEVAELLAGLAFNLIPDDGRELKIADFACGTGALLKAAYRQVRRRAEHKKTNMNALHKTYMEKCLHGADIQPIAAHLTAAGLAGMNPAADYDNSNVICADIREGKTGSLDLLKTESLRDLFGSSAKGVDKTESDFSPADRTFDLCIMNPPYSRPHGGKKIFGVEGMPDYSRKQSVDNLNKALQGSFANMKAGMASAFCYLADRKLKPGGVLAAVLPLSAAGQNSWRKFRAHIAANYENITVVAMAAETLQSFSAETGMGEMLICARKNNGDGEKTSGEVTFVNLNRLPREFVEANETARALRGVKAEGELKVGEYIFATCVKLHPQKGESWGGGGIKNYETAEIAVNITEGMLKNPGLVGEFKFAAPPASLVSHAGIGPSHDKIGHPTGGDGRGAFAFRELRRVDKVNLSLWKADRKKQTRLLCAPTHRGCLVSGREELAARMMKKQSTLFLSRNFRMTSQKLAAAMTEKPCMGGSAWNALQCPKKARAAYCLWFNSLPGLMVRWWCGGRQHPGRARMQLGDLAQLPCPAFSGKSPVAKRAVKIANKEFPRLAKLTLMPCSFAWRDKNRAEIDRVVLQMLKITMPEENIQILREQWCREPSVHGGNKKILETLHADKLI